MQSSAINRNVELHQAVQRARTVFRSALWPCRVLAAENRWRPRCAGCELCKAITASGGAKQVAHSEFAHLTDDEVRHSSSRKDGSLGFPICCSSIDRRVSGSYFGLVPRYWSCF